MIPLIKKKILIIESDKQWSDTLDQNLSQYPYDISIASKGKHGFELAKQNKPDIILSSTQLDDIDGIDLCWMIRQTPETSKIIYFLFTDHINPEEKINAFRSGVDAILDKKTTMREIYTRIEAIIKRTKQINSTSTSNNKSLQGKLSHFAVVEILQMLHISKKSGTLSFSTNKKTAELGFWEGKLVWAKQDKLKGADAVKEIVRWEHGFFTFEKDLIHPIVNINTPTMQLILDCCQQLDEQNHKLTKSN